VETVGHDADRARRVAEGQLGAGDREVEQQDAEKDGVDAAMALTQPECP
jgi:hypothetical protein